VEIIINASQKVMVKYKHDNANFYFVFLKNLESAMRMPEVVMDINNSKSATWQSDDWWFHVSGTDCESNGSPNNYSNCQPVQPGWEGVPNMSSGPPYTDTVEIRISFTKVGLTLPTHSVIGLAFDVTNTFSAWNFWPSGANINSPATWATAILCAPSWLHEISGNYGIHIYPNPSQKDMLYFRSGQEMKSLEMFDTRGKVLFSSGPINNSFFELDTRAFPSGIYFCKAILSSGKHFIHKVILD
jgi:hypothetical protein